MAQQHTLDTAADLETDAPHKGPLRLIGELLVLAIAILASLMAIILMIPDKNDYSKATLLKNDRLAAIEGRKVVLVGGSNLAYGMESDVIQDATGCPTVNMGMNGYFGVRYMLNEVKPRLRDGDIVVLAFEWDNYAKTVDGAGKDLFAVSRTNPSAISRLTPKQMAMAASNLPYVAQTKLFRVIDDTLRGIMPSGGDRVVGSTVLDQIEVLDGFDEQGDLNSHEGVVWELAYEPGADLAAHGLEEPLIDLIKGFSADMAARDITVVVSYTPTMRSYYEEQKAVIDEAHRQLTSGEDAVNAPRAPEAFVFDADYFFDTVYHLKTTTRAERSQMVADDIQTVLGSTPDCRATAQQGESS
ncbi:hypothetical protein WNY37_14390 [Henriciella sp. AS95]|uniref:hypothetical protein n=1 Tax=Henriciella sp. AS95 TaxID=3135782 RepID=UPI00316C8B31